MTENIKSFVDEFDQFTEQGIIAHSQVFEIVEVLGYSTRGITFNVLTIVIASETLAQTNPTHLGPCIRVDGIKGVRFGVRKSVVPIAKVRKAIEGWRTSGTWNLFGKNICVGKLNPLARRFVPADWDNRIALNRVIKNNFFSGSYILELFDSSKEHVRELFSKPEMLTSISDKVGNVIPIEIADISDRIGNIIFQFSVEVIRANFNTEGSSHCVEVAWHPKTEPRGLLAVGSIYHDQTLVALGCAGISSGKAEICVGAYVGSFRGFIWDVEKKLLLAATDDINCIKRAEMKIEISGNEQKRTFPKSVCNGSNPIQLRLRTNSPFLTRIGDFSGEKILGYIQSRIHDEERRALADRRSFAQYGARGELIKEDKGRALADLRWLISKHGRVDVWLWDPYLEAQGVLDSLFWNAHSGSQMRALARWDNKNKRNNFTNQLTNLRSNLLGLDIEFRSVPGDKVKEESLFFHDRFLIFPRSGGTGPKAWLLGASINELGGKYHIFQQVGDAQLVVDAFESHWDVASESKNLIWKCP